MRKVAIVMGSKSDLPVAEKAVGVLRDYGVQTTAVEEAETLGLKVTVKHVYSDALAGTVVEQSIAQDTVVTTGAEIVLTVSDGPDPSVSGTEGIPPEAA